MSSCNSVVSYFFLLFLKRWSGPHVSPVNADRLTGCEDYLILSPQKSRYWDGLAKTSFSSHTEPAGEILKKPRLSLPRCVSCNSNKF